MYIRMRSLFPIMDRVMLSVINVLKGEISDVEIVIDLICQFVERPLRDRLRSRRLHIKWTTAQLRLIIKHKLVN